MSILQSMITNPEILELPSAEGDDVLAFNSLLCSYDNLGYRAKQHIWRWETTIQTTFDPVLTSFPTYNKGYKMTSMGLEWVDCMKLNTGELIHYY